jgi:hypothetical protein
MPVGSIADLIVATMSQNGVFGRVIESIAWTLMRYGKKPSRRPDSNNSR